jgi:hypothetical protein
MSGFETPCGIGAHHRGARLQGSIDRQQKRHRFAPSSRSAQAKRARKKKPRKAVAIQGLATQGRPTPPETRDGSDVDKT